VIFARWQPLESGFARRGQELSLTHAFEPDVNAVRTARLCAEHNLTLEPRTLETLRGLPVGDPLESRSELTRLLLAPHAAAGVQALRQTGWLATAWPELEACAEVLPFGFHHLNVLEHQIEALRVLLELFPASNLETRLATLLHDVGKPASRIWDEARGRWSFFGHDDMGARLVVPMLSPFGFEAALTQRVSLLIARHMIRLPADETQAARFVRRQRALLPDLLYVMLSDREASRGASSSAEARFAYQLGFERVLSAMNVFDTVKPLLTGREVMEFLELPAGPLIGQALEVLAQLQSSGDISTPIEARAALERWATVRGLAKRPFLE
jgi:poly(A) polymerase